MTMTDQDIADFKKLTELYQSNKEEFLKFMEKKCNETKTDRFTKPAIAVYKKFTSFLKKTHEIKVNTKPRMKKFHYIEAIIDSCKEGRHTETKQHEEEDSVQQLNMNTKELDLVRSQLHKLQMLNDDNKTSTRINQSLKEKNTYLKENVNKLQAQNTKLKEHVEYSRKKLQKHGELQAYNTTCEGTVEKLREKLHKHEEVQAQNTKLKEKVYHLLQKHEELQSKNTILKENVGHLKKTLHKHEEAQSHKKKLHEKKSVHNTPLKEDNNNIIVKPKVRVAVKQESIKISPASSKRRREVCLAPRSQLAGTLLAVRHGLVEPLLVAAQDRPTSQP